MMQSKNNKATKKVNLNLKILAIIPGFLFCIFFIYKSSFLLNGERVFTLSDDVMISMSYAKNLIQHGQFTWFEGADRVQGYTNFLYTIFLAIIHLFEFSYSFNAFAVSLVNLLLIALISFKVINLSLKITKNELNISLMLGALIPFQYPLIFWSLRGFEVGILSYLLISIFEELTKIVEVNKVKNNNPLIKLYILLTIGILVRLDFVVVLLAVNLYLLIFSKNNKVNFKYFLINNFILLMAVISLLGFQYFYYGSIVPNTFYLKTEGFSLIEKIPRGVLSSFKIFPLLLISFLLFSNSLINTKKNNISIPIFFLSFFLILYNIIIGGDAWEVYGFANRFITPLIPLQILLIASIDFEKFSNIKFIYKNIIYGTFLVSVFFFNLTISKILGFEKINSNDFAITTYEITFFIFCLFFIFSSINSKKYFLPIIVTIYLSFSHIAYMVNTEVQIVSTDFLNTQLGQKLNNVTKENAKIAVFWAGNIAYYSERDMVDLLGKSDSFIAMGPAVREETKSRYNFNDFFPGHNKWNFEYSIGELKPDIIVRSWENSDFYFYTDKYDYIESCIVINTVDGEKEFNIYIKKGSDNIYLTKMHYCLDSQ